MKIIRKSLSMILALCMVLQILPVFATEMNVSEVETNIPETIYIINDQFGNEDLNDWELKNANGTTIGTEDISEAKDGSNYALKFSVPDSAKESSAHVLRTVAGSDGIKYEDGKDVVIKTRIKKAATGIRAYLKFNIDTAATGERASNYFSLFCLHESGIFYGKSGGINKCSIFNSDIEDKWINAEVRIHGTSKTATYIFTDDNGTVEKITEQNITQPESINAVEDALKTLAVRARNAAGDIYVDYVQVWVEHESKFEIDGSYAPGEEIKVGFNVPLDEAFTDAAAAVKLYNADGEIEAQATADAETNTVTLVPDVDITEGEYYTVKLDESKIYTNYVFDTAQKQFYASKKKYITYNDFEDGSMGNWRLGKTTVAATSYEYGVKDGAMYLKLLTACAQNTAGRPNLVSDFKGVEYQEGKNIVIKARIMTTGANGNTRTPLKLNRPDDANLNVANMTAHWYTIGELRGDNYFNGTSSGIGSQVAVSSNQWIDVEIKYNGVTKTGTTTITCNGTTTTKSITIYEPADALTAAGVDTTTGFTEFNSLTFLPANWNSDSSSFEILVDQIYAYEETSVTPALASEAAYGDDDIVINLDNGVNYLPEGAVVLKDAEGNAVEGITVTNDKDAKTITLHSETPLEVGKYTIELDDSEILEIFTVKSLALDIISTDAMGMVVNQQFNTTDDCEEWRVAPSNNLDATVEQTEKDGYGVLAITANSAMTSDDAGNGRSAAHFDMPEKIYFRDGANIVIKTRFYHDTDDANAALETPVTTRAMFKYNRPEQLAEQDPDEIKHNLGILFTENTGKLGVKTGQSGTDTEKPQDTISNFKLDADDKWIDLEMNLDFVNGTAMYKVKETGTDAEETITGSLATKHPQNALESLAVVFRGLHSTIYFDYITVTEIFTANAAIDAKEVAANSDIGAYITKASDRLVIEDFSDLVDIYDAEGNKVEAAKSFDFASKKVTINPDENLVTGTYTVKFDKAEFEKRDISLTTGSEFTFDVITSVDVNETFDSDLSGWAFRADMAPGTKNAEIVTEGDNKFLRISYTGSHPEGGGHGVTYSRTFDSGEKFVRDMKSNTVFEIKLRTNLNGLRKYIKLNYPTEGVDKVNGYNEIAWNTRVAAVMHQSGYIGSAYSDYRDENYESRIQGRVEEVSKYEVNKWYTVKTVFNNVAKTATTYVYDGEELVGMLEDKELTAWWFEWYDCDKTQPQIMHTIDDITIQFRNKITVENEYIDIDDIKLYNETKQTEEVAAVLKDLDGNIVTVPDANTTVIPEFKLYPKDGVSTDYVVISAKYVAGKLEDTHIKEITTTGEIYTEPDGYAIGNDESNVVIKAFVWDGISTMMPLCETAVAQTPEKLKVYVETYGDDKNEGTADAPLASISKAITVLTNKHQSGEFNGTGEIVVGGGEYYINNQISVSATNPVTENGELVIKAAEGEKPVIIGGVPFDISDAVKVEDENITNKLSDPAAAEHLYMLDLTDKVALEDIPAVGYPGSYDLNQWIDPDLPLNTCEAFIDNELMTVARYPNADAETPYMTVTSVAKPGAVPRNWESDKTDIYDEANDGKIGDLTNVFEIKYADEQADKWVNANQALMFGFWKFDWATQTVPLAGVNADTNTITAGHPSNYGVTEGARYYVFNLLEEIDVPGEYFIDRETGKMYFYKPVNVAEDAKIVLTFKEFDIFYFWNAKNVEIDGINLSATRGRAVRVVSGNNIRIKNCEVSNVAATALSTNGSNILIENCHIHDVDGGIYMVGGDLETLTYSNNVVKNCEIENFSRISKTYTPAIKFDGVGNTAIHNEIHNSEHSAIGFSGAYNTMSYNEIYDVCKEADDAGAFYVGRSWTNRGNKLTGNYFHDIKPTVVQKNPCGGVFFDDHYAGLHIEGNVFENISGCGVRGNGGRENTITNNVFVNCTTGIAIPNTSETSFATHYALLDSSYYQTEVWKNAFPELYNIKQNYPEEHRDNVVTNNLTVNCGTSLSFGDKVTPYLTKSGNYETYSDPGFKDIANRDYTITAETMKEKITGFKTIEFEKMGRQTQ